jgi:transcriptional regulator with XRE-family HTH domain
MLDTDKIKAAREAAGLTMEAAARRSGFTNRQQWFLIESGKRTDVKVSTLTKIARAIGVDPCELLAQDAGKRKRSKS